MDHDEIDNDAVEGTEPSGEESAPDEPLVEEWVDDEWLEDDADWGDTDAHTEVIGEEPAIAYVPLDESADAQPTTALDIPLEEQRKRALALAGIAVVLFSAGYLIGNMNGSNIDAAETAGKKAGTAAGLKAGKTAGYDNGFKKGEETAYKAAYSKAYRAANPNGVPDAAKAYKDR